VLALNSPSTVANLTLLNTSRLTHDLATPTAPNALDLTISGTLSIAAGASIDVTHQSQTTANGAAGSHGGRGKDLSAILPSAFSSGALFDPREGGGSGGGGYRGGGIVRVKAGTISLDGSLLANGEDGYVASPTRFSLGGGGGTVNLDVTTLTGAGS